MKTIKAELLKIIKSWQAPAGLALVGGLGLMITLYIKARGYANISALDIVAYVTVNLSGSAYIYIVLAMVSSLILAGEFQFGTLKYILIRPISLVRLFFSKLTAIWIYIALILTLVLGFVFILASFFWEVFPLHGKNNVILDFGLLRVFFLFAALLVISIYTISQTVLLSILIKNQISVVVTTIIVYIILSYLNSFFPLIQRIFPISMNSIIPEVGVFDFSIFGLLVKFLLILFYSLLFIIISYFIMKNSNIDT